MTARKTALKSELDDAYATIRTLARLLADLDEQLNPGVSGEGDS